MTLFLYVIREFFRFVFGALFICLFLFVLFDFVHKTTRYIPRYNPSSELLIKAYLCQFPNMLVQALPIASLLGSVISMVLLGRSNEVTAMRAVGLGPFRIGLPIVVGGGILTLFALLVGELVLPESSKRLHFIQEVLIERGSDSEIAEGARWAKSRNELYNFREFDPIASMMTGVKVLEIGENFRPKKSIDARIATFRPEFKDWLLEDVHVIYFWPKGTLAYSEFRDLLPMAIPIEPNKLRKERRLPSELSTKELLDLIKKGAEHGSDILSYRVDLHSKIALYFAPLVVCLIGLKFGYRSERAVETARGILLAVGIGMSYWFLHSSARALAMSGILDPISAAWAANILVGGAGILGILPFSNKC